MTASQSRKQGGLRLPAAPWRIRAKRFPDPDHEGCLIFPFNQNQKGYGRLTVDGHTGQLAHRVIWEDAIGPIPDDFCVLHRCDNPPCTREEHLFLGTKGENNTDMRLKGRMVYPPGRGQIKIPLSEVPVILSRYAGGDTKSDIARDYGVTRQAIHYYLRREGLA